MAGWRDSAAGPAWELRAVRGGGGDHRGQCAGPGGCGRQSAERRVYVHGRDVGDCCYTQGG